MSSLYLGLMSGTSFDGVDAAIVDFTATPRLQFARTFPLPSELREQLVGIIENGGQATAEILGRLDNAFGQAFALVVEQAIQQGGFEPADINAAGVHGQTLWHAPDGENGFTWQIGDPNIIAARTGIPVVADFRRKDMALGGQGAPLASGFHREIFSSLAPAAVINLGGIANITVLKDNAVTGFDTGPANGLMDAWYQRHQDGTFDRDGAWGVSGTVIPGLLDKLLSDPFFSQPTPRSTGREYFNTAWLEQHIDGSENPADVQATLCELTAKTVANEVNKAGVEHAIVVGGGAHNPALMKRLGALLDSAELSLSSSHGHDPDFIEAAAFAWLAMRRLEGLPGNVASVTGASRDTVLGGIYLP